MSILPGVGSSSKLAQLSDRIAARRREGGGVVAPFVTAGDPDMETSLAILEAVERGGADLCELGVPYSDPIADGPVIQASYTRALAAGFTLERLFELVREATRRVRMPILAMASYSLIYRRGIDRFVGDAASAGAAGFVVPDLPLEESEHLENACRDAGLALVRLVTPTTPADRAERIARRSTGFVYCVSVAGVTGTRTDLPAGLRDRVAWLKSRTDVPVLVGFGVSDPDQVRAIVSVADGAIVGSALVRQVAAAAGQPREAVAEAVERFVAGLVAAGGRNAAAPGR